MWIRTTRKGREVLVQVKPFLDSLLQQLDEIFLEPSEQKRLIVFHQASVEELSRTRVLRNLD